MENVTPSLNRRYSTNNSLTSLGNINPEMLDMIQEESFNVFKGSTTDLINNLVKKCNNKSNLSLSQSLEDVTPLESLETLQKDDEKEERDGRYGRNSNNNDDGSFIIMNKKRSISPSVKGVYRRRSNSPTSISPDMKSLIKKINIINQFNGSSIDWIIIHLMVSGEWKTFELLGYSFNSVDSIKKVLFLTALIIGIISFIGRVNIL